MSRKRGVLLGIEGFEQRRSGIAAEVAADLVDFVEHENRIFGFGAANALDDLSGQRADVGAAMAADFGFIVNAAEREPHELAAEGARDRLAERSLAHAGRSDEAQDRAFHVRLQATDGEIVEDAILDLLEVVVIGIQNFFGFGDLDLLTGSLGPGQHGEPLDVVARE